VTRCLLVLCLVLLASCAKLPCQGNLRSWRRSLNIDLSPTETLTDTIYEGINVVVEKKDENSVSGNIKRIGTWEPTNM